MNKNGLLLCAKYAVPPNFFGYCGPDENQSLRQHLQENLADKEINHILAEFETLYPYLQLISRENNINDPFDEKVVEAYWLGNNLLEKVSNNQYIPFLNERLKAEKKLSNVTYQKLRTNLLKTKFLPHHNFHVVNIFKNSQINRNLLQTMDECRINYGRIIQKSKIKSQNYNSKFKSNIQVETKQLIINSKQLTMSQSYVVKRITIDQNNRDLLKKIKSDSIVSFHWGIVCDILNERQVKNLEFYTQGAINFFNS